MLIDQERTCHSNSNNIHYQIELKRFVANFVSRYYEHHNGRRNLIYMYTTLGSHLRADTRNCVKNNLHKHQRDRKYQKRFAGAGYVMPS